MNDKRDLMKYMGSMQQAAYIRPLTYAEGRSTGLKAYEVKNGPLCYKLMADKCLDMCELSYKGVNFSFLSKPGLQGRNAYDTAGDEAIRGIMGGMFFTCGVETICAPCTVDGVDYPMHGRMRTTPGEHLSADAFWAEDGYHLRASAEMREAALFGENMTLRRSIETVYGQKTVTLTDVFENQGYRDEPLMLLYHINLGWPFLDENLRLILPTRKVTPRDAEAEGHEGEYDRMDPPKDNEPEYVFIHDLAPDADGSLRAVAVNEALGLGLEIGWNEANLPYFMEWKSTASGDYVIGLEPANSSVYGRPWHEERDTVHRLAPFATEKNVLTFTILDGQDEINQAIQKIKK
ncbi:MAG: aldose 1-epimerase family protein [Clostridia bacterium]|nr:aldose 1-epimerase family protein [Clostridia bacterium]MBQ6122938.1 aldose 1-epimerase family protein [Clostridia bacterium]MBQ6327250.1 aldose 1-epimerase family protein [Clostridia bacterium]MBQ8963508.1 aldose 1-epimerase family protein [Clostridia bacterium]MBQ9039809.1 aldose 1-epimerase family protein [Clostridia bacterium]